MPPALTASALLIAVTFGYILVCTVSPFGRCRRCNGLGFHLETTRTGKPKRGKTCRRCRGAGIRLRTGRRVHNAWMRTYRDGTR